MAPLLDLLWPRPRVLVDFVFEDGVLFIAVQNAGHRAAHDVAVAFDPPVVGLGGEKEISALPLFRDLTFLPPGKTIRAFLDTSAAYFARKAPTQIQTTATYRDDGGRAYKSTLRHNLEIYRDIGYVTR